MEKRGGQKVRVTARPRSKGEAGENTRAELNLQVAWEKLSDARIRQYTYCGGG